MTTLALPPMRIIYPYGYNERDAMEDETYVHEIEDAICTGRTVSSVTSGERSEHGAPKRGVSTTCFRDPRAAEIRYAVEVWNGSRLGKYDYAEGAAADRSAEQWVRSLGVRA